MRDVTADLGNFVAAPPLSGWVALPATLAYSSTDGHTFVCTTALDLTGSVSVGMKIRLVTGSTTAYFIVTAISSSSITLYGGTTYSLTAAAITQVYYSNAQQPLGFNRDPTIWTEVLNDGGNRSQASPSPNTWYNLGTLSVAVPIGIWVPRYKVELEEVAPTPSPAVALSTSNAGVSDQTLFLEWSVSAIPSGRLSMSPVGDPQVLTVKTTYYLVALTRQAGSTSLSFRGDLCNTNVRFVCAYV